ncbi:MAG: ABC transporter permease [Anaerolineales bacterium]
MSSIERPTARARVWSGRFPLLKHTSTGRQRWLALVLPFIVTALVLLPIGRLVYELLTPSWELWQHMWDTFLPQMLENTLRLVIGVGLGTGIIGVGYAWLVSAYQFPGRAWFERLFLLPLAVPTFVMGFIFMATFDYAGPVQTQWRAWFGDGAYFPDIRSGLGVTIVMTLVLYPYVYLLARAAFRAQSASTFEAARLMGYSRTGAFFRLVLPLARPAIVAGMVLAMMEAMTDYGAVSFFSFPTLSEGIVRIWEGRMDRDTATQLAAILMLFALGILLLEYILRGQKRYTQEGLRGRQLERTPLRGPRGWLASAACLALLSAAFILPFIQLIVWAVTEVREPSVGAWRSIYTDYITNSVRFAGLAGLIVIGLSLLVAYGVRANALSGNRLVPRVMARLMTLGYALPGAVIAVGVLMLVAPFDHDLTDWVEINLGREERSLLITGTLTGLVYAYVVRFMAVGYNSVETSMERVNPSLEEAARTMGARSPRIIARVHMPLVRGGMIAGAILVFVDVMKEIPATLLLRPFGSDTLALWAYFLAFESFWQAAAIPSLTIVTIGLLPVLWLMQLDESRRL